MGRTVIVIALLVAVLALAGCQTRAQAACNGHGGLASIANGWSKCEDGTWQRPG